MFSTLLEYFDKKYISDRIKDVKLGFVLHCRMKWMLVSDKILRNRSYNVEMILVLVSKWSILNAFILEK